MTAHPEDPPRLNFPIRWRRSSGRMGGADEPPILLGDDVVFRDGTALVCLSCADGSDRWTLDFGPKSGSGSHLTAAGSVIFADMQTRGEPATLVAVGADGHKLWTATYRPRIGALLAAHDRVFVTERGVGNVSLLLRGIVDADHVPSGSLHVLDARTGRALASTPGLVVDAMVATSDGILAVLGGPTVGLYLAPADLSAAVRLDARPPLDLVATIEADRAIAVHGKNDDWRAGAGRVLEAWSMSARTRAWTREVAGPFVACDGEEVVVLDRDVAGLLVTCLDAASGATRWSTPLLSPDAQPVRATKVEPLGRVGLTGSLAFVEIGGDFGDGVFFRRSDGECLGPYLRCTPASRGTRVYARCWDEMLCGEMSGTTSSAAGTDAG